MYETLSDLASQTRMAPGTREVMSFAEELAQRTGPYAKHDLNELQSFARAHLGLEQLEPWDVAFASERLRESHYAYSDDEVKQYFTEPQVQEGLFTTLSRLFGIVIRPVEIAAWQDRKSTRLNSSH